MARVLHASQSNVDGSSSCQATPGLGVGNSRELDCSNRDSGQSQTDVQLPWVFWRGVGKSLAAYNVIFFPECSICQYEWNLAVAFCYVQKKTKPKYNKQNPMLSQCKLQTCVNREFIVCSRKGQFWIFISFSALLCHVEVSLCASIIYTYFRNWWKSVKNYLQSCFES